MESANDRRQTTDNRQTPRIKEVINACLSFERDFFSLSQVVLKTLIGRDIVRHKLWKLEKAGLITRVNCFETRLPGFSNGRPTKEICYRNTKLLKGKVEGVVRQAHHDNSWDKMWRTVRALRRFTNSDLETICGLGFSNVRFFVKRYRRFGYFRPLGKKGRETVWGLANDPGARRPLTPHPNPLPQGARGNAEVQSVD